MRTFKHFSRSFHAVNCKIDVRVPLVSSRVLRVPIKLPVPIITSLIEVPPGKHSTPLEWGDVPCFRQTVNSHTQSKTFETSILQKIKVHILLVSTRGLSILLKLPTVSIMITSLIIEVPTGNTPPPRMGGHTHSEANMYFQAFAAQ